MTACCVEEGAGAQDMVGHKGAVGGERLRRLRGETAPSEGVGERCKKMGKKMEKRY